MVTQIVVWDGNADTRVEKVTRAVVFEWYENSDVGTVARIIVSERQRGQFCR
jgi:hypothetical protein